MTAALGKQKDHSPLQPSMADRLLLGCVLFFGISLSLSIGVALNDNESLRLREIRSATTQAVLGTFDKDLVRIIEFVRGAALMIESQQNLTRDDFNLYVQSATLNQRAIHLVEWQPVVPAASLTGFERNARAQGLTNYRVVQPSQDLQNWEPVQGRDEYAPVLFAWPDRYGTMGNDTSFNSGLMQSKQEAGVTGQPVASGLIGTAGSAAGKLGPQDISVSAPVYRRDGSIQGYLVASINLPTLLLEAAIIANRANLDLLVYDLNNKDPIYAWIASDSDIQTGMQQKVDKNLRDLVSTVDFARQSWEVVLHPRPSFESAHPLILVFGVPAACMAMTAMLLFAVARMQRSRREMTQAELAAQQARETVVQQHQRLQNIVEATDAGTWDYNYTTGRLEVNARWAVMSGMTIAELQAIPGYDWHDYCHPDDQDHLAAALQQHTQGSSDRYEVEYRHLRKDGTWLWVAEKGKVLSRTTDGKPEIFAGTLTDITLRREAQERIVELNATLESRVEQRSAELESTLRHLQHTQEELTKTEARATLGTLVASVSHELATPMGNSLLSAGAITDAVNHFEKLQEAGQIKRSDLTTFHSHVRDGSALLTRNLKRAVELLGKFRQVAADQASEQRRAFDLGQVVAEVVETLAPSLKNRPHRVVIEIAPGIVMDSFPGPLGQIVINLVNNAFLHAFDDRNPGQFSIHAALLTDAVHLTFRDNGRGIDTETLAHIFEPFFSTKIGAGGTGLGMAIVENLVTRTLSGEMSIRSTVGVGTTIEVTLPLKAPEPKSV